MSIITEPHTISGIPSHLICGICGKDKPLKAFGWTKTHHHRHGCLYCYRKQADRLLREKILVAYGSKCACCGEAHEEFLTIDHIGNWGHLDKARRTSQILYRLRREGFPKDKYRLLCYNCNCSIGMRGYCPHNPEAKCLPAQELSIQRKNRIRLIADAVSSFKARKQAAQEASK